MLDSSVASEIEHRLPVLLERLPRQNLCEEISRIRLTWDVSHVDTPSAAQLTHLEELAIDVTRIGSGCEAVAQVISGFAVGVDLDSIRRLVP